LVAGSDVMFIGVGIGDGCWLWCYVALCWDGSWFLALMLCCLMLGCELVAGSDVMFLDVGMGVGCRL